MGEKIAFENCRFSNFQELVTLTFTLDRVILHTVMHPRRPIPTHQISLKSKKLFVDGRRDVRTGGRTFETHYHFIRNNWSLLSLCYTLSLESAPCVSSSTSFWYQFLHFRLNYSFIHHFFLFWFTTVHIHNSLSVLFPTNLFHKSYPRSFTSFSRTAFMSGPFLLRYSVFRNVNVLRYVCYMLWAVRLSSVCRLSVVCDVGAPYSGGWTFRQFFFTIR